MKRNKVTSFISAVILLFCCGFIVWLLPNDEENSVNESPTIIREEMDEETEKESTLNSATPTPLPQVQVNVSSANIRNGPGTNYPSFEFAFEGDIFDVIASNNAKDWYVISLGNGDFGWINRKSVV